MVVLVATVQLAAFSVATLWMFSCLEHQQDAAIENQCQLIEKSIADLRQVAVASSSPTAQRIDRNLAAEESYLSDIRAAAATFSETLNRSRNVFFGFTLLIGLANVGLILSILTRAKTDIDSLNLELEQQVSEKTQQLMRTQNAVIFGLAKLAENRDTDTGQHLERIRRYVTLLAEDLRCSYGFIDDEFIRSLGLASSLHDIGKVGIPDAILLKPGRLTEKERDVMQHHTVIGGECLEAIHERLGENPFMEMAKQVAYSHHERWDGEGYPHQISGEEIPLVARIVSVADVYDALTSKRPYKRAMTHEESRKILLQGRGSQFDPSVIEAFLRHEEKFLAISEQQKHVSDADCISGLQRLASSIEELSAEAEAVLSAEMNSPPESDAGPRTAEYAFEDLDDEPFRKGGDGRFA